MTSAPGLVPQETVRRLLVQPPFRLACDKQGLMPRLACLCPMRQASLICPSSCTAETLCPFFCCEFSRS